MENLILHKRGCEVLARFGNNPFGEPIYRIVRADSRRQWIADVSREWPACELAPKYPKFGQCYIIEKWCPVEQYGAREAWEEAKTLGPYPTKGDYEFVLPVWDEHDRPLTEPGEHHLQAIAWMVEKSAGMTRSMRWAQIQQAQDKAKEERRKKLEDMVADAAPLRGGEAERKHGEALEESFKKAQLLQRPQMPLGASLG